MEITYSYQGQEYRREFSQAVLNIGRPSGAGFPDLDLSPDLRVSRQHARIWHENGSYWIEDTNSRSGTYVNGEPLVGKCPLISGDAILMGETVVKAVFSKTAPAPVHVQPAPQVRNMSELSLEQLVESGSAETFRAATTDMDYSRTLAGFLELPFQMARDQSLDDLLQHMLERSLTMVPKALRGIVLLYNDQSNDFTPHAQVAMNLSCVDENLARRTLIDACGLFCHRAPQASPGVAQACGHSAMYAPIFWAQRPLGLLVVDNPSRDEPFVEAHLRILMATAQQIALILTNHKLQENTVQQRRFLDAAMHAFSPNDRQRLLEKARGSAATTMPVEISDTAILAIDVQPLLTLEKAGPPAEISATLHEYFSAWRDTVHKYDGVVCGQLIAVFGVLEPDPKQVEKAVRAALAIQWLNKSLNSQREARKKACYDFGMAIHCGDLFHGFAGALEHFDFIVHGQPLLAASALAASAPLGEILVSSELSQRVYQQLILERISDIGMALNGKSVPAFRLKGLDERSSWGTMQTVKMPV